MIEAIQVEVERIIPSSAKSSEDIRTRLVEAAQVAQEKLTAELQNALAQSALGGEAAS